MKIYVLSSNQYSHLLPLYATLFNKYWPDQEVTVLCYDIPNFSLPSNFNTISLGKQSIQLEPVLRYFRDVCKEEYFILLLEDLLLIDYVDVAKISRLEEEVKSGADKADLHFYTDSTVKDLNNGLVELKQDVPYRTSMQPGIWTRKYFLKHLRPDDTWWSFEVQHQNTMHNGAKIIFLKEQSYPHPLFDTINVYLRGQMMSHQFRAKDRNKDENGVVHEEDIQLLKQLIK